MHRRNPFWPTEPAPNRPRNSLHQHILQSHMSMANLSTPFPQPPPSPALSAESSSTIIQQQQQHFERLCELERNLIERERERERERQRQREIERNRDRDRAREREREREREKEKEKERERELEEKQQRLQQQEKENPEHLHYQRLLRSRILQQQQQRQQKQQQKSTPDWSRNPWWGHVDNNKSMPTAIDSTSNSADPIQPKKTIGPSTNTAVLTHLPVLSSAPSIPILNTMASVDSIASAVSGSSPHDRSSDMSDGEDQAFGVPLNSPPPIAVLEREREWEREQEQQKESLKANVKEGSNMADLLGLFGEDTDDDLGKDGGAGIDDFAPVFSSGSASASGSRSETNLGNMNSGHVSHNSYHSPALQQYPVVTPTDARQSPATPLAPGSAASSALAVAPETKYLTPLPSNFQTPTTAPGPHRGIMPSFFSPSQDERRERPDKTAPQTPSSSSLPDPPASDFLQIPITIITPAIIQEATKVIPSLLTRMGWPPLVGQRVYAWTIQHPRVALLFWMCDEMKAWQLASMYNLRDDMLPFGEDDLQGIATEPEKVMKNQWRVMCKELPKTGGHIDYGPSERLPLHSYGELKRARGKSDESGADNRTDHRTDDPRWDRVCWLSETASGQSKNKVYMRKRLRLSISFHSGVAMRQISKFRTPIHRNVDQILCSYSQSHSFAFISPMADMNLEDYLTNSIPPSGAPNSKLFPNREAQLLGWINDLADAMSVLHEQHIYHRSVRPRKILISGKRIYFSVFGFGESALSGPKLDLDHTSEGNPEGYVYAAPEIVRSDCVMPLMSSAPSSSSLSGLGGSHTGGGGGGVSATTTAWPFASSRADVFSLGCVFLSMISNVRGYRQSDFTAFRVGSGTDPSFHSNLPRVQAWMKQMRGARIPDIASLLRGSGNLSGVGPNSQSAASSSSNTPPSVPSPDTVTPPSGNPYTAPHPLVSYAVSSGLPQSCAYGPDRLRDLDLSPLLCWIDQMLILDPSRRRKMRRVAAGISDWHQEHERRTGVWPSRRNSFGGMLTSTSSSTSQSIGGGGGGGTGGGGGGFGHTAGPTAGPVVSMNGGNVGGHSYVNVQQQRIPIQSISGKMQLPMPMPMPHRVIALGGGIQGGHGMAKESGFGLRRTTGVIGRSDGNGNGAGLAGWGGAASR